MDSETGVKIAFIKNQEEFDELTRHRSHIYRPQGAYRDAEFTFQGPKHYLYIEYLVERGCGCRCEDEVIRFITSDKELNGLIHSLNREKEFIDKRIAYIETTKEFLNQPEYTEDYIPEQQYRDWM